MSYKISILAFFLFVSCDGQKKETILKTKSSTNLTHRKIKMSKKNLSNLPYEEAVKKYGKPLIKDKFILGKDRSEFRIQVYNFFTKEQIANKSILIQECSWELDKKNNITAWYRDDKKEKPIQVYIWDKEAEF